MDALYSIAAVLFFTYALSYLGMILLQPIAAIIRVLTANRSDSEYAIGLKKYLLSLATYIVILVSSLQYPDIGLEWYIYSIYILILPWVFIIWYIQHIRKWNKKHKNIKEFDKQKLINTDLENRYFLDSITKKNSSLKGSFNLSETYTSISKKSTFQIPKKILEFHLNH